VSPVGSLTFYRPELIGRQEIHQSPRHHDRAPDRLPDQVLLGRPARQLLQEDLVRLFGRADARPQLSVHLDDELVLLLFQVGLIGMGPGSAYDPFGVTQP
jgi:hypothetical protein